MRTLHARVRRARAEKRGVALLLALLLLVVLIAITIQISVTTGTDARIARNDLTLSIMDMSIESALLQVDETLKTDGQSEGEGSTGGAPATGDPASGATPPPSGAPGAAGGEGESEATDSQRDEWHEPQRTTINDIQLRIFVQDEDSKYNVLNMLAPDEKEAQAAYDRVVRILDFCREGSREFDIDPRVADEMAKTMLEHMRRRKESKVPRPQLLSDVEDADEGLPQSLEEFGALRPFEEHHFRDFRDRDGEVVHSIGSFLTVWTSLGLAADLPQAAKSGASGSGAAGAGAAGTGGNNAGTSGSGSSSRDRAGSGGQGGTGGTSGGAGGTGGTGGSGAGGSGGAGQNQGQGQAGGAAGTGSSGATTSGGYAVNVNTAPAAVLKALFDDREVHPRFFDKVIEYRNLEEEEEEGEKSDVEKAAEDEEPELDEYGQEKIDRRIFDTLGELAEVEGFKDLPAEQQNKINQLLTTKSNVFTIFVVARKSTSVQGDMDAALSPAELRRKEESAGDGLVRVVRSVVWRHTVDEEIVLTPIVRWEVIDYVPFEILDFPPDDR